MKKTRPKIQAWTYCWLSLIVICGVLPVRADQMTVQATSTGSRGTLTVKGFDTSLGTLTEVDISATIDATATLTNTGSTSILNFNPMFELTGQVSGPDNLNLFLFGAVKLNNATTVFGGASITPTGQATVVPSVTVLPAFSDYQTSTVSFDNDATLTLESALPGQISLSNETLRTTLNVTYDYTPFVSAVPEPAAVVLFGTMAAACLWFTRKRREGLKKVKT